MRAPAMAGADAAPEGDAAPHQSPGCDRGVEAAGEQAHALQLLARGLGEDLDAGVEDVLQHQRMDDGVDLRIDSFRPPDRYFQ